MFKTLGTLFVAVVICSPLLVDASTVLRTGDGIAVEADQVVEGDYYVSVGPLGKTEMSGDVIGDMYAVGGTVRVNGTIGADLGIIGGVSNMHASVTDDVRIVSGETVIAEHIGGDLFVLGGVLKILSTASVDGDIFFYGGEAEISGSTGGSIHGAAETVRIDGTVAGNVDIDVSGALTLGSRANIAGNFTYPSNAAFNRAQNAVIEGTITEVPVTHKSSRETTRDFLMPLFLSLFAALSVYLLFRTQLQKLVYGIDDTYVKSGLIGIAALVLGPALSVLLMVTVLGLYIGLMSLAITLLLYVASISIAGIVFGAFLAKMFTKKPKVSLPWILIGACAIQAVIYVPVIGPACVVTIIALTAGGLVLSIYKMLS